MRYDVAIVGGGPAGLTAGLYAARRALATVILTKGLGGQAATTPEIENYPGLDFTDGLDLMMKFRDQAEKHGAAVVYLEVEGIERAPDGFRLRTPQQTYEARAVILAFGLTPRDLGVPGEERLKGRGVSYCVTCDGPLFKGKRVAVVGGGTAALDAAEFLAKIAGEVHLIHDREKLRGSPALVEKVMGDAAVAKHLGQKVVEILGEERVAAVAVQGAERRELSVDAVFVENGYAAQTDWLRSVVELDRRGQVVTDKSCRTSCPGIFSAGDVADIEYKQVVISAGEGAKAALQAYRYLRGSEERSIVPDWGFVKE